MTTDRVPTIRILLMPKDTNALGTIFGGVILAHLDLASAIEARKVAKATPRSSTRRRFSLGVSPGSRKRPQCGPIRP
jgi:hypothetical protein